MKLKFFAVAVVLLLFSLRIQAAPYDTMDYGPFISATYKTQWPKDNIVYRGIGLKFLAPIEGEKVPDPGVDKKGKKLPAINPAECGVLFDTELLRYAAVWNGGFIQWTGVVFDGAHGANPQAKGTQFLGTKFGPGWAKGDGKDPQSWKDPRPIPHGPLPRDWARYKGLYRHGNNVVFSYTVGQANVLDLPRIEVKDGMRIFNRYVSISNNTDGPLVMVLAHVEGDNGIPKIAPGNAAIEKAGKVTLASVASEGRVEGVLNNDGSTITLTIPAGGNGTNLRISLWHGDKDALPKAIAATAKFAPSADPVLFTKPGQPLWKETVTTAGKLGDDKQAYTIDQIAVPFKNPTNSWMRIGGFDFFKDGRAAVCTWSGDVWIVSGIDAKLDKVVWKRYAAGLFHALGLRIVNDQVYVLGRDQITRLQDLNNDGEADFYECFNNDSYVTSNFHEFTFDLQTDKEGNFYFIKGGPVRPGGSGWDKITPHHGTICKVSPDGKKFEIVARGFRAPNGMCVSPDGQITTGDNEGTWTPMCPINWIKPGGFYGVPEFAGKDPKTAVRDNPLCWMPKNVDNSNGGQVWIDSDKFGPLSRQLLHTSYGTCNLFNVLKEEQQGQMQGGVFQLLHFDSGVCRARFNQAENALYLTGLRGWQTQAQKDAGFYRVRYTGKPANIPVDLKVTPAGIQLTFSDPLDRKSADADNFSIQQWNYRWTSSYGSQHYKVSDPKKTGQDEVEVESATLSSDGKTVTLKINDLKPVMQMKITYNLRSAAGQQMKASIHNTINVVGNLRGELHPGEFRIVRIGDDKK